MGFLNNFFGKKPQQYPPEPQPEAVIDVSQLEDIGPEQDSIDQWMDSSSWLTMASSNVEAIRYLPEDATLEVEFKNGSYYQYFSVPRNIVRGFVESLSPGRYVWNELRDRFDYAMLAGVSRAIPRSRQKPTVVRVRRDLG